MLRTSSVYGVFSVECPGIARTDVKERSGIKTMATWRSCENGHFLDNTSSFEACS